MDLSSRPLAGTDAPTMFDGVDSIEREHEAQEPSSNTARRPPATGIVNAMTVDVEDYFQVFAFDKYIDRAAWDAREQRVEPRVDQILNLFDARGVKGTFFTLGWIAERFPDMVRRIVAEGHELASHGWDHRMVTTLTPDEFSSDVQRAKAFLEDLSGVEITGYRAPCYSINGSNHVTAHAALAKHGYRYSSSIAPISHDIYGWPEASVEPFLVANGDLLEVPISTIEVAGRNIACGGGGWFRLYPYSLSRLFARRINQAGRRYIFYFHPWEFDSEQPRVPDINLKTRFRHYLNLGRMESRVSRMLRDFEWDRMDKVFACELASVNNTQANKPIGVSATGSTRDQSLIQRSRS